MADLVLPTTDDIRDQVNMDALVSFLLDENNMQPMEGDMCCCFFHDDSTPSAIVNENSIYCFACEEHWDRIDLVRKLYDLTFEKSLLWFAEHMDVLPEQPERVYNKKSEYHGPVNPPVVDYWHSLLDPEKRQWLYNERLLTDATIDLYKIGWRPDLRAYSIPFWRGYPGKSEIDIVQFRSTKDSPQIKYRDWKYIGLKNHNRPSIVNPHLINPVMTILFVGTLDAVLAAQDGFPAISTNGVGVFLRDEENKARLRHSIYRYGKPKHLFLVPDTSSSELLPSYRMAEHLEAEVKFFPFDAAGKDYTEYRYHGGTKESFMGNVLGMDSPFLNDEEALQIREVMDHMCAGDKAKALTALSVLESKPFSPVFLCHTMQLYACHAATYYPNPAYYKAFTPEVWEQIVIEMRMATRYPEMKEFISKWADIAYRNQGGF